MKYKSLLISTLLFFLVFGSFAQEADSLSDTAKSGTFVDKRDKKTYEWIVIGKQTWMAENLAYKPKGGGYWEYNFSSTYVEKYGYLYAYIVAKNVCPKGWHLPSDDEWRILTKTLGGEIVAGTKMKSKTGWKYSDSTKNTDESGFNALPGGYRDGYGVFYSFKEIGYWWSSTSSSSIDYAWLRGLFHDRSYVARFENWRPSGLSVRCVKNEIKGDKTNNDSEIEEIIEE